jgi:hypothetical protein
MLDDCKSKKKSKSLALWALLSPIGIVVYHYLSQLKIQDKTKR